MPWDPFLIFFNVWTVLLQWWTVREQWQNSAWTVKFVSWTVNFAPLNAWKQKKKRKKKTWDAGFSGNAESKRSFRWIQTLTINLPTIIYKLLIKINTKKNAKGALKIKHLLYQEKILLTYEAHISYLTKKIKQISLY